MGTKKLPQSLARLGLALVAAVLIGGYTIGFAQAAPPAQDPRPPIDGGSGGNGGSSKSDSGGSGPSAITCASVSGEILNWGFRTEPNVVTTLKTGSWQDTRLSDNDGRYSFGGLGLGIAMLNVTLAPGEHLTALTHDAVVYLTCDYPTIANIALYSGDSIEPPVTIAMTAASQAVTAAAETEITLTVKNSMPTEITNVIVTSLIHPGLVPVAAAAPGVDSEKVQIINGGDDGQVLVAYLDTVASGATAKVKLTVTAVEDTPFTDIRNTATVFYSESVANQTSLDLTINSSNLAVPAALASQNSNETQSVAGAEKSSVGEVTKEEPTAAASDQETTSATEPSAATTATSSTPSTTSAEAEAASAEAEPPESAFAPPQADDDSLLPKTGQAPAGGPSQANATIPLTASVLLLLGFIAYGVKSVRQRTI